MKTSQRGKFGRTSRTSCCWSTGPKTKNKNQKRKPHGRAKLQGKKGKGELMADRYNHDALAVRQLSIKGEVLDALPMKQRVYIYSIVQYIHSSIGRSVHKSKTLISFKQKISDALVVMVGLHVGCAKRLSYRRYHQPQPHQALPQHIQDRL